jgi:hypothetical protein
VEAFTYIPFLFVFIVAQKMVSDATRCCKSFCIVWCWQTGRIKGTNKSFCISKYVLERGLEIASCSTLVQGVFNMTLVEHLNGVYDV